MCVHRVSLASKTLREDIWRYVGSVSVADAEFYRENAVPPSAIHLLSSRTTLRHVEMLDVAAFKVGQYDQCSAAFISLMKRNQKCLRSIIMYESKCSDVVAGSYHQIFFSSTRGGLGNAIDSILTPKILQVVGRGLTRLSIHPSYTADSSVCSESTLTSIVKYCPNLKSFSLQYDHPCHCHPPIDLVALKQNMLELEELELTTSNCMHKYWRFLFPRLANLAGPCNSACSGLELPIEPAVSHSSTNRFRTFHDVQNAEHF